MALEVIAGTIAAQPLNNNFSEGKNNLDTHLASTSPHASATNLVKTDGSNPITGTLKSESLIPAFVTNTTAVTGDRAVIVGQRSGEIKLDLMLKTSSNDAALRVWVGAAGVEVASDMIVLLNNASAVKISPGKMLLGATVSFTVGTGSPEGVVTAVIGSLFQRSDGGAVTTLYVKESGAGNTGWVAK